MKLPRGVMGSVRCCGGGSAAESSLPRFERMAALFWELGSGNRKTNEGNGLRGYLQCSSAREIEGWGSAASSPRRRRGGGREEVLGSPGWRGEGWRLQREATGGGRGAA